MYKIWSPYGWEFDFLPVSEVRMTRSGVDSTWSKQASVAPIFDGVFEEYPLQKGHTLLWVAPVAALEKFSCNVNGDSFSKKACQDYHHTFLTAHKFMEHANDDPSKGTGRPVASAYNEKMARIEILVDIENDKNPLAMQKIANGEPIDTSMACRVDYDVCSICGNKATHREGPMPDENNPDELNTPGAGYCKHARYALSQFLDDGRRVYVDNPHPNFFDISEVKTAAEVIARTMRLRKAASRGTTVSGAELAAEAGFNRPLYVKAALPNRYRNKLQLGNKLAQIEKQIPGQAMEVGTLARALPRFSQVLRKTLKKSSSRPTGVQGILDETGIILGLRDFAQLIENYPESTIKQAQSRLGDLFTSLASANLLADVCNNGTYDNPPETFDLELKKVARDSVKEASIFPDAIRERTVLGEQVTIKKAKNVGVADPQSDQLLQKYAAYLLATLTSGTMNEYHKLAAPMTVVRLMVESNMSESPGDKQ